jgi:hypothetical protein
MPLLGSIPLPPNYHEWKAVLADMGLSEGVLRITAETMVVWARDTQRSMTEAVEVLRGERRGGTISNWPKAVTCSRSLGLTSSTRLSERFWTEGRM